MSTHKAATINVECSDCGELAGAHGDGDHTWCEWSTDEVLTFAAATCDCYSCEQARAADAERCLTPDTIRAKFKEHWGGGSEELDDAIWALIEDLLDSIALAEGTPTCGPVKAAVVDYVINHY
jgi:hypothetical protein